MPKLTKRLIDSTPRPDEGHLFLRDSGLRGFGLRLTKGSSSFFLEKFIQGRVRRVTIGPYGPLTLDQAKKIAEEMIGRIAKGENPVEDRLGKKHEKTFGFLADQCLERHKKWKESPRNVRAVLENHLAHWRGRKLSSIYRNDVSLLHAKIGESAPYQANRIVAMLRKMFNLARVWGIFDGDNPATGIELFRETKRDRFLNRDELKSFINTLDEVSDPYIKTLFGCAIFTGARIGEVLTMKWEDLDLDSGVWRIPDTKADRPHLIALPKHVRSMLGSLPRLHENPYVFPGREAGAHLVNVSKAWYRIRDRAKLPTDTRIHDLRRTLGSWLAGSGISLHMIGKILNHSQPGTTAIYARLDLEPVRAVLEANAKKMLQIAGKNAKTIKNNS